MRTYEQYCPLARALDVVGDRWAMLILRELYFSPKRFTDIEKRLEGIAPNLLSKRLKAMEAAGLIRRRRLEPPATATVYELDERGRGLETAMLELSRWGVQFLGPYTGDEAFYLEWLIPVMEEFANRDAARGVKESYQFVIDGAAFWVDVDDGEVTIRSGYAPAEPDLSVETDIATFMAIGFETISPEEAASLGSTRIRGDLSKVERSLDILAPARVMSKLSAV